MCTKFKRRQEIENRRRKAKTTNDNVVELTPNIENYIQ